jgi:multiple sugar transport system substrate-binding protein
MPDLQNQAAHPPTQEGSFMNRKRRLRVAVAALVAFWTLTFAGASAAGPSQQTIVLSGWPESPQATATLESVVAAFEAAHPTIHVDYQPLSNYPADIEARFSAGNPPDVFYVDSSLAPDWIARGLMLPLRGFATRSGFDTSHFFPVLLRGFEGPGGKPYGFPKDWSPLAMYTNDALLAQAGTSAPSTWSQLRSAAERIRAATGVTPICLSADWARLLAFVEENGGSFLNDSRTEATIDSPAAKGAVEFYLGLVRDGLAASPSDLGVGWCGEAISDGEVAVAFEGNWLVPVLNGAVPAIPYSIHPMPANVRRGNLSFTVAYAIASASQHKQAAWELLSYLTGRDGMQRWVDGGVALPSRDDVSPLPGSEVFLGEAAISTVWAFAPGFEDVINLANDELGAVFAGSETIDGMLAAIQAAASAALAAAGPSG